MSEAKRLHPAAILFNFLKVIREFLFAIILGFITFRNESFFYFILIASVLIILMISYSVASWYRYTYRIEEDELRIEYGILIRKKRFISINRIQSIDLTASVIHRFLKLVRVKIETAGSGLGSEASLTAVKLSEGEQLRSELKRERVSADQTEEVVENQAPVRKITFKRLFLSGTTSGSIGIIAAIFAFVFSEMEQFIPDNIYESTINWVIGLSIVILIVLGVLVLILLWVLGIAGTMIKYGNFTITKNEKELFITRGLLEKKQLTIPLSRIQAVGIEESLIRQPLGYVTVFAQIAGGSMRKGEEFPTVLFPILKKSEVEDFLQEFLPDYASQHDSMTLLPKRALKFYLFRPMLPVVFLLAGVWYFLPQFIWVPVAFLIGASILGYLRFKDAGYHLTGERLTISYRRVSKMTMLIYHRRIQSFEKKQHKLHLKQKLASMKLSIIAGLGGQHFPIKELEEKDVDLLSDWYSYRR